MVFFQLNVTGLLFQSFRTASPQPVRKRHFFNVSQMIEPLSRPNLSPSEGIFFFIIIFD